MSPRLLNRSGRLRAATSLAAALLATASPAAAQDERPTGYPRSANEGEHRPVAFSVVYTADLRADASGGLARGARYLDNLDLQLAVDADRLVGWHGARWFAYVLHDNGVHLSPTLVGDAQGVSNVETDVRTWRLFEAWVEQDVGSFASVKIGLYNLNSEFDTTVSGGLFLVSSHGVGPDLSQSGRNGPSIFPSTSLAARAEYALGDHLLVRAAVLDGVPDDPAHPARTAVKLSGKDGALLIGEADWLTRRSKIALGTWRYTSPFNRLGEASRARGNGGAYLLAETQLTGAGERGGPGLSGWVRIGAADARFNPIAQYLGGGVVQNGVGSRKDDQLGLSLALARFGPRARGLGATVGQEAVIEAAYRLAPASWLSLQPDLQWVVSPSGRRDVPNAIVTGLRVKIGR